MVNAASTQTDQMPVVAPYEPDRSYLMLRLTGQQAGRSAATARAATVQAFPASVGRATLGAPMERSGMGVSVSTRGGP